MFCCSQSEMDLKFGAEAERGRISRKGEILAQLSEHIKPEWPPCCLEGGRTTLLSKSEVMELFSTPLGLGMPPLQGKKALKRKDIHSDTD